MVSECVDVVTRGRAGACGVVWVEVTDIGFAPSEAWLGGHGKSLELPFSLQQNLPLARAV